MTAQITDRGNVRLSIAIVVLIGTAAMLVLLSTVLGSGLEIGDRGADEPGNTSATSTATTIQITDTSLRTSPTPTPGGNELSSSTPFTTPTSSPIPTVIPTATPAPTPLPAVAQTSTRTATPVNEFSNQKYREFVSVVFGEAEVDAQVPIRIRAWKVAEGNSLIVVLNLTAESENDAKRVKQVNTLVSSGYAQAVAHYDTGKIGGKITDRLRIAEINNTGATPKTLVVNTSLAREYYTGQINAVEFSERYWETERNMTAEEIDFVHGMATRTGNITLHNETAN